MIKVSSSKWMQFSRSFTFIFFILPLQLDDSDSEGSLKDFICDEEEEAKSTSSSSDSDSSGSIKSVKSVKRHPRGRVTRANAALAGGIDVINEELENDKPKQWWEMIIDDGDLDSIECSGKLYLLFEILKRCEAIGDKVWVAGC